MRVPPGDNEEVSGGGRGGVTAEELALLGPYREAAHGGKVKRERKPLVSLACQPTIRSAG